MYETIPPLYYETDVDELISIHSPEDVEADRQLLVDIIWGEPGLPDRLPDKVQAGAIEPADFGVENVQRIDRLTIDMDYGIDSIAYLFIPENGNEKVVIWHEGHQYNWHTKYIQEFVDQGYTVLAFNMPMYGENSTPVVDIPHIGSIRLYFHDYLVFLTPESGHPVKYLLEPVIVGLNYLEEEYDFNQIAMVGSSGGGWTTTLGAAIDPRVQYSVPIAGTYPIYLRAYEDRDHYESQLPEIYTQVNFLELYIMGGYGPGRSQLQVINQYDPCCYTGIKGDLYKDNVAAALESLGSGSWALKIDPYSEHGISPEVFASIFDLLGGR